MADDARTDDTPGDTTRASDRRSLRLYLLVSIVGIMLCSVTAARLTPEPEGVAMSLLIVSAAWAYAFGAAVLCFWAHYKAAQVTYRYYLVDEVGAVPNRVLYAMLCMSVAHLGQMTYWGAIMWVAANWMGLGDLSGDVSGGATATFVDYLHFAFASYTSLGLGDVMPEDYIKLITGVTTLTGLLCIGWTASLFVGKMGDLMEER